MERPAMSHQALSMRTQAAHEPARRCLSSVYSFAGEDFSVEGREAAPRLRAARPRAPTRNFMGKQHNKEIKRSRRQQLLKRRKEALRTALATPGAARKAAAERKAAPKKKVAAKKPAVKKVAPAAPVAEVAAVEAAAE